MSLKALFLEAAGDFRYDPWGSTMAVYFCAVEILNFERGADIDPVHHYRPGAAREVADTDRWEYVILKDVPTSELERLALLCHRLSDRLHRAGRSY